MRFKIIISLLLISPVFLLAQNQSELTAQIEKLNKIYTEAMINNDTKTMMSLYTNDVISLPSYQPMIKGIDSLRSLSEQAENSDWKTSSFDLKTTDVFPAGNLIIEVGNYKMTMTGPGIPEWKDEGKYITVWQKQNDGNLKIKIEMWNTDLNPWQEMQQSQGEKK
ncbi:YybH family protein [Ignavibacterium album]|uniref:YybH family protein n=1 Tax=Ignavibacterium album TaxID=591197 RepID=UPI0035B8C8C1